jgi:hypothetical protein
MWTDKTRSGRCYLESFCVDDPGCPFLASCLRSRADTEPMRPFDEEAAIDRLLQDITNKPRRLGSLWNWIRVRLPYR